MRVTSVDLYSNDTEAVSLSLTRPNPRAKYLVRAIMGLDADEIIPRFYGFGSVSRPKYYDFSLKEREIVMRVVLNPNYSINESNSELRDELYRAIAGNRSGVVTLQFLSGATTVAGITGFITKFEVPHFSKTAEVQITVKCDDPIFRGINPVIFDEMGNTATGTAFSVPDNRSTAPHGFDMELTFTADAQTFIMRDPDDSEWEFRMVAGTIGGVSNFKLGDVLHFSSEYATRRVYLVRSGVTHHLMDKVTLDSVWPLIFPGNNVFEFESNAANTFNVSSISYYPAYWGV